MQTKTNRPPVILSGQSAENPGHHVCMPGVFSGSGQQQVLPESAKLFCLNHKNVKRPAMVSLIFCG